MKEKKDKTGMRGACGIKKEMKGESKKTRVAEIINKGCSLNGKAFAAPSLLS